MNEALLIIISLIAGLILGGFYFGGLWWTVNRLPKVNNPVFLSLGSFFLRTVITLGGFYLTAKGGRWYRVVIALAGFLAVRVLLINKLRPAKISSLKTRRK
ncbi:MAG: ATP synthase subunit I [Acidobacteriota bacterium]